MRRRDALTRSCRSALQPFETLESRTLLTIVQPAGQDYLAFEAEDPQATFTDLDSDGFQWAVISGATTVGNNTLPSGGAAIQALRDASGGTANTEGQVSYPIQLTSAGPYFFYARTKYTSSGGDNSMYLPDGRTAGPIDADPAQQWDNRADSQNDYHWNNLDVNGASFTYTNPTPGAPTTLKMNIRENGYIVDKIVLSTTAKTPAQLDALLGQSAVAVPGPQLGQATVRFTPVTGATSYNIFRSTNAATGFTQIGTAGGALTSFIDQTLPAGSSGQTFYYTVQPVTASGPGAQTSPAAAVVINSGARASYFNDLFWGSGGRSSTRRTLETFRAGPFPDVQTIVPTVDNNWGTGSPDPAIRPDNFSSIFTGKINLPADLDNDGTPNAPILITFGIGSDDDGIFFVNGQEAAEDMGPPGHGQQDKRGTPIQLVEGQSYNFVGMQAEQGGGAALTLRWVNPATNALEPIPAQYLTALADTPAAPTLLPAPVIAPATADPNAPAVPNKRMVTFTFTDNSTSELWFELLRDGQVVGTAELHTPTTTDDQDPNFATRNNGTISDAQPLADGQAHSYTIRAVNYDGTSAASAPISVTVPATYYDNADAAATSPANGVWAHYYNSASWNGGRVGNGLSGGLDIPAAGLADYSEVLNTVDSNYDTMGNSPVTAARDPVTPIQDESFSTAWTGEILIPADFNGNSTNGDTVQVQFVGNTDDHGIYFVNGQLAAISFIPRGQGDYTGAGPVTLVEGQRYDFTVLQAEQFGGAGVHFKWVNGGVTQVVPNSNLFVLQGAPSAAPSNVGGIGSGDFNIVTFTDNATNEVRYEVERAPVTGGTPGAYTLVGYAGINGSSFLDRSAVPGQAYRYRVTAVNFEGRSAAATATTDLTRPLIDPVPNAATNGSARLALGHGSIQFTDNAFNETSYIIQRKAVGAPDSSFAAIPGTPTSFNGPGQTGVVTFEDFDPNIAANTAYVYRVIPVNRSGVQGTPLDITGVVTPAFRTTFVQSQYAAGANPEVVRGDFAVDYGWGGGVPDARIGADNFHAWFEGFYTAPVAGDYTFATITDDGARLFVDGNKVIDKWIDQGDTRYASPPITLTAGQKVELRFEMYERAGGATARLLVTPPGGAEQPVVASAGPDPAAALRAPIEATATVTTGNSIAVRWLDTTANETGFDVLRSTTPDSGFTKIATVGKDAQAYFDNTGAVGTDYYYQVRAANGATAGPVSNTTDAAQPAPDVATGGAVTYNDFAAVSVLDPNPWTLRGRATFADEDGDPAGTTEVLRLTDNLNDQTGGAFLTDPRNVEGFTASFDFSTNPGSGDPADGFTFVVGRGTAGAPPSLGGGGGGLAYVGDALRNTFAIKFDLYPGKINQLGAYENGTDIFDDANDPRNRNVPVATFDFEAAKKFHVDITYSDVSKQVTLKLDDVGDPSTAPLTYTWGRDIPTIIGSGFGFVGFTAATGGENAEQDIYSFSYTPGEPVTASPAVSDVYVRGTAWTAAFKQYLENKGLGNHDFGYRLLSGGAPVAGPAADPDQILPWINMNEMVLKYSAAPTGSGIPTAGSVVFTSAKGVTYTASSVTPVAGDPTAFVITLNQPLGGGNPTTGVAPTANENGDRITLGVPGGGAGGSALSLRMNVLQGDTDHTGETGGTHSVLAADYSAVKKKFFKDTTDTTTGDTSYSPFHDVNANGSILANDFSEVKKRFFQNLAPLAAASDPLALSGVTKDLFGSSAIL